MARTKKDNAPEPMESYGNPATHSRTIAFPCGGRLTLSVSFDPFEISGDDLAFLSEMIDRFGLYPGDGAFEG